jgi:hypothetical protein
MAIALEAQRQVRTGARAGSRRAQRNPRR